MWDVASAAPQSSQQSLHVLQVAEQRNQSPGALRSGNRRHSTCAVASCCVFAKLYQFVLSCVLACKQQTPGAACSRRCAPFVLQPSGRRFLFLSSQARAIVQSSTWSIVSAVVGFVSCRVLQLFRISCVSLHLAASPAAACCAYCFDSLCQIYIKFITTHASQSPDI